MESFAGENARACQDRHEFAGVCWPVDRAIKGPGRSQAKTCPVCGMFVSFSMKSIIANLSCRYFVTDC